MLFQLRDNDPNIRNRNRWSLFGGGINRKEKPFDAAIRELKEELGLKIKRDKLRLWMVIPGIRKKSYLFKLKLSNKLYSLKLMEGAAMGYFKSYEMKKKKNVVKSLRALLYFYPFISRLINKYA